MQPTDRIDVLTTQLAATDRRALSQAWYDAMHVAEHAPHERLRRRPPSQTSPHTERPTREAHATAGAGNRREASPVALTARTTERRSDGAMQDTARHAPRSAVARRLERAFVQRRDRMPSSFSISTAAGRVHLLIRSDGSRTRLVVLCLPSLRERVERALADVRFGLAGRELAAEVL